MNADARCSSLPVLPRLLCHLRRILMQQANEQESKHSAVSHICQRLATHELKRTQNTWVECRQGKVWITGAGSLHDTILSSGEVFESENDVLVVVQALEPSCLLLKSKKGGLKP